MLQNNTGKGQITLESGDIKWIDLSKPRYDQSSYGNRFMRMMEVCGPLSWPHLFVTQKQLKKHLDVLKRCEEGEIFRESIIWKAKSVKDSIVHPDSNKPILWPFRMSAHVLMNTILLVGMLSSRTSLQHGISQFANQSFNAGQFYANRNATNNITNKDLFWSYVGAVGSSIGLAVGMNEMLKRITFRNPLVFSVMREIIPFSAVVFSKPLQIAIMRRDEIQNGVFIKDAEDNTLGKSRKAGFRAVYETVVSRVAYLAQPMLLPPVFMWYMRRTALLKRYPLLAGPIFVAFVGSMSAIATPACIAMFKQEASIPAKRLESQFWNMKDAQGNVIDTLYYNKGL